MTARRQSIDFCDVQAIRRVTRCLTTREVNQSRRVSTSTPLSVTNTLCSNCADRLPSRVTTVQSSSSTTTSDAGAAFLPHAREILAKVESAKHALRGVPGQGRAPMPLGGLISVPRERG
jgi:hypothetical protein